MTKRPFIVVSTVYSIVNIFDIFISLHCEYIYIYSACTTRKLLYSAFSRAANSINENVRKCHTSNQLYDGQQNRCYNLIEMMKIGHFHEQMRSVDISHAFVSVRSECFGLFLFLCMFL